MRCEANAPVEDDCEVPLQEAPLPIWHELGWWLDWIELRRSAVYHGSGVPDGNRATVVAVPGFLGSDNNLSELRRWLARVGYLVAPSGISRNIDCPDVELGRLLKAVEVASRVSGQRVQLIGHSLGGTLSRAAAIRRPDLISQVLTLASPIREVIAHPLVINAAKFLRTHLSAPKNAPGDLEGHFHDGTCSCETLEALSQSFPDEVARTAIYTRSDGVIDWRTALDTDPRLNLEVHGTHVGLVVNREVYEALGRLLSAAGDQTDRSGMRRRKQSVPV